MKFGFDLECDRDFEESIQQAILAEQLGYDWSTRPISPADGPAILR